MSTMIRTVSQFNTLMDHPDREHGARMVRRSAVPLPLELQGLDDHDPRILGWARANHTCTPLESREYWRYWGGVLRRAGVDAELHPDFPVWDVDPEPEADEKRDDAHKGAKPRISPAERFLLSLVNEWGDIEADSVRLSLEALREYYDKDEELESPGSCYDVLGWADDLTRRLERAVAAYREEESAERRALLAELWVQGRAEDRRDRTEREERAERDRQMIYRTLGLPYGSTE